MSDFADWTGFVIFLAIAFGLPALGYAFLVLDIRAYLRSLKRALVVVTQYATAKPEWSLKARPPALRALGLDTDCDEDDVRAAYRRLAEECHPDLGGNPHEFNRLRKHYEDALAYARHRSASARRSRK